jgi:hypothetical protein
MSDAWGGSAILAGELQLRPADGARHLRNTGWAAGELGPLLVFPRDDGDLRLFYADLRRLVPQPRAAAEASRRHDALRRRRGLQHVEVIDYHRHDGKLRPDDGLRWHDVSLWAPRNLADAARPLAVDVEPGPWLPSAAVFERALGELCDFLDDGLAADAPAPSLADGAVWVAGERLFLVNAGAFRRADALPAPPAALARELARGLAGLARAFAGLWARNNGLSADLLSLDVADGLNSLDDFRTALLEGRFRVGGRDLRLRCRVWALGQAAWTAPAVLPLVPQPLPLDARAPPIDPELAAVAADLKAPVELPPVPPQPDADAALEYLEKAVPAALDGRRQERHRLLRLWQLLDLADRQARRARAEADAARQQAAADHGARADAEKKADRLAAERDALRRQIGHLDQLTAENIRLKTDLERARNAAEQLREESGELRTQVRRMRDTQVMHLPRPAPVAPAPPARRFPLAWALVAVLAVLVVVLAVLLFRKSKDGGAARTHEAPGACAPGCACAPPGALLFKRGGLEG